MGGDLVLLWTAEEVRRHMQDAGVASWFEGFDGGKLMDILHDLPYDVSAVLREKHESSEDAEDDGGVEKRLKDVRTHFFSCLRHRLGAVGPRSPEKSLHKILLLRNVLNAAWEAASGSRLLVVPCESRSSKALPRRRRSSAKFGMSSATAARILYEYGCSSLSSAPHFESAESVRALTRVVDALRFALSSPGSAAAAYAYDGMDGGQPQDGRTIFQHAARNLATTMLEAVRAGLAAAEGSSESSENEPRLALIHETLRLVRSVLCALCVLCPEKKEIDQPSRRTRGTDANARLELVCNEVLIPLVFLLEHSVGKYIPNHMLRARVERAIRGPFAALLHLLSWHADNLVSLFNTQRNLVVLVALYWLSPARKTAPVGESEHLIRRHLVTVVWSFAKKKDRAVQLATPEMLHPLLNCLDQENQRDIRFRAAGALELLLTHRSSLGMMPKDDDGSEILGSKRDVAEVVDSLSAAEKSSDPFSPPLPPPLSDAVLTKLLPTLAIVTGAAFDDDDDKALDLLVFPSSDYLQLTLAACANLTYLAIACEKEQPDHATWLSEQVQRRLLESSSSSSGNVTEEDSLLLLQKAAERVPELQEPRVHYELLRLLWVLLRLKIHPKNQNNAAAKSLLAATGLLDVECASAGVIFDDVAPDDLKLHCIQDLLRYLESDDHEGSFPGGAATEPLRAFAAWILAHYSYRRDDSKHITYQSAFITIARLITDDARSSLYATVLEATVTGSIFYTRTSYNAAAAKLLTLRLLARCLRNLARSDVTASLVVEHTRIGSPGALHALNRLAWLGFTLEKDQPTVSATTMFLSTKGGHYFQELASHDKHVKRGRAHHKCVPIIVSLDHSDPASKRRVRQAATNARVRFVEKKKGSSTTNERHHRDSSSSSSDDGSSSSGAEEELGVDENEEDEEDEENEEDEFRVTPGCVPNSIQILQETAETLERLAAHNQIRAFFGTHGSLGLVVRLALQKRFSPGVAFKVLLDTPRSLLANQVIVGAARSDPKKAFWTSGISGRPTLPSHPRWLIADISELILTTLEDAPDEVVSNSHRHRGGGPGSDDDLVDGKKREKQVAPLLALQLATSMLAQDDTQHHAQHPNQTKSNATAAGTTVHESPRGKQVIVRRGSTGELVTGICLKLLGPTTKATKDGQSFLDVILDSGELMSGVPAKHVTMAQLTQQPFAAASSPASHSGGGKVHHYYYDENVAFFVHPSHTPEASVVAVSPSGMGVAPSTNGETSLFLYFVKEADRFFSVLERCSGNVTLAAAACNLCESLSNALRRSLQSGASTQSAEAMLASLGHFCERQLARLVGDCACGDCCPETLRQVVGDACCDGGMGIFFTSLYLLEASVLLYKQRQHASCSHRGFVFGIPTLVYNAVSALHAQVFDTALGELAPDLQRRVVDLSRKIQQPTKKKGDHDHHHDASPDKRKQDGPQAILFRAENNDDDEDVRHGNNLLNSAFRAVLSVFELARACDTHRTTRQSESQPMLLKEMMANSQTTLRALERTSSQNLTHQENSVLVDDNKRQRSSTRLLARDISEVKGLLGGRKDTEEQRREVRETQRCTRRILFGVRGTADLEKAEASQEQEAKTNKWSMNADENPLYSKLRSLCCHVVRLGVGHKGLRLDQETYAQHAAIRSSLRFLSCLGSDLLMARKLQEVPPTAEKRFVAALVRCVKWHPYWAHYHLVKKDEDRRLRASPQKKDLAAAAEDFFDPPSPSSPRRQSSSLESPAPLSKAPAPKMKKKLNMTATSSQMGDLLAVEACKLVQKLSANLNQRHLMVFPETARKFASVGRRARHKNASEQSLDGDDDDEKLILSETQNDLKSIQVRSQNGCLPGLTLLAGAKGRSDVDILVRAAAVAALKEIASNSTICSEALCAWDGVTRLVTAARVGNHPLRRNVAYIFSLIAMTPSIRRQLLENYQALLLLLQLQALRDNPHVDDDTQVVAYAAKALKCLSTNSALVYLEALKTCVKRIDTWKTPILNTATDLYHGSTTTIGVALLGPGYQELLQLALQGLGDAASHSEMADVLIGNRGIETLLECLQIRDANIITSTARTLAALVNHIVAFETKKRSQSKAIVCRVIDRILLLVWPYAHRAARTLQRLCRKQIARRWSKTVHHGAHDALDAHITLVPVSAALVGMAATAIERVARDHGLGDYLVHQGALEALAARLTPDGYKHDEEECLRLLGARPEEPPSSSSSGAAQATTTTRALSEEKKQDTTFKNDPPIVQVLSAIAQLAHNAPHCLPAGRTERTLSIVCAFHHNKRCRHLAMLALWRIRPVANGAAELPLDIYQEGSRDDNIAPPPPVYWDDDDVVTWLGCIGFGSIGKTMRTYLARPQLQSNIELLKAIDWTKSRQYRHTGWTRRSVEKARDTYGQATAGGKLLALTAADLRVGGRLKLSESQVRSLELGAFASELRELHLRMREVVQDYAYDVRVPSLLLFRGRRDSYSEEQQQHHHHQNNSIEEDWPTMETTITRVSAARPNLETEVILGASHVRRYRALFAEASAIFSTSDERSGSVDLADLAREAITEARRAYEEYHSDHFQEAQKAALLAQAAADKVRDAVALNRVKHAPMKESSEEAGFMRPKTPGLEDLGETILNGPGTEPTILRWSDTLWYELSSAPSVDIFNRSRSIRARPREQDDEASASVASVAHEDEETPGERSTTMDFEEICLWPTEGDGFEAARVREVRRLKRTPTGVLQKVSKAPIRDRRGLAHLFEVRFIDARVMLPGGRTALMMCAKEGDLTMVQLLLDNVEAQLGGSRAAMSDTMKYTRILNSHTTTTNKPASFPWRTSGTTRRLRHWSSASSSSSSSYDCHQIRHYDPSVFSVLEAAARPNKVDDNGHTALHHALRSLLRIIERACEESAAVNPEHLISRVEVVHTLISRVALPHSAKVFEHGTDDNHNFFRESHRKEAPADALALMVLCYGKTQRKRSASEYNISDECSPLGNAIEGLEPVASRLDDMMASMFRCGFTFNGAVIREAHKYHLLARLRYLYVENCDTDSVERLLNEIPSIFLKRNVDVKLHNKDGAMAVLPKAYTTPWEAPVFGLKALQFVTQKVWAAKMMFRVNRQLVVYVVFMLIVLYVAAEIVGMELFMLSRDAFQQALRTRLVEEEWYPANGFLEVATPDDFWQWVEGPMLGAIYEPQLPVWRSDGSEDQDAAGAGTSEGGVFPLLGGLGIAIGQPRLRMVATRPNEQFAGGCGYGPSRMRFGRRDSTRCFSFFSEEAQLDRNLKKKGLSESSSTLVSEALEYKTPTVGFLGIDAPSVYGYQSYYPGSSGYVAGLPKDEAEGRALMASLKDASWLSQNTRAIMLEFLCYSPSDHHGHNLVTQVRLLAEFSPMGAVLCSGRIRALRIFVYKTWRDFVRLAFEIGWLICNFFLFRAEVQQMAASFEREKTIDEDQEDRHHHHRFGGGYSRTTRRNHPSKVFFQRSFLAGLKHLRRVRRGISNYAVAHFNIFDLFQFHVFLWLVVCHVVSLAFAAQVDWGLLVNADSIDARQTRRHLSTAMIVVQIAEARLFCLGLYVFLSFLKLLDRMRVRESLHVLIVEEMTKKIFSFLIVMTICVLAFSFTAFFARLGGAQGPMGGEAKGVGGGEAFLSAFVSQMRQLIGDIDYETAYNSDPRFGIIFCIITFLVLPVLLMNLLIAIMLEAYESVRNAAAARYCYLQQAAYVDYFKAHDAFQTDATHWLALIIGAICFPLLVVERLYVNVRFGLHYVWTDIFHPERRIVQGAEVLEVNDDDTTKAARFIRALRYVGVVRSFSVLNKTKHNRVKVHPTPSSASTIETHSRLSDQDYPSLQHKG